MLVAGRVEGHVHLSGTLTFADILDNAKDMDKACKAKGLQPGQYLTTDLLEAAAKVLMRRSLGNSIVQGENVPITLRNASLDYWEQYVFQPIERQNLTVLSQANRDKLKGLQTLWRSWQSSTDADKAGIRDRCCEMLSDPLIIGCLLPTFEVLSMQDSLNTVLKEVTNSQGCHCRPDSTYDNFLEFEFKFNIGDAYIERGGQAYMVKLLKKNSEVLRSDNVHCVEYSVGIKPDTARDMIEAAKEAEKLGVKIRFLASFRGTNQADGLKKLKRLDEACQLHKDLFDWVKGVDVMGDETIRDYMPFKVPAIKAFVEKHRLGVRIHLGEAVNPELDLAERYHTMFHGCDAAWAALDVGLKVRIGHGLYFKQLVQDLHDEKVAVPLDMQSDEFKVSSKQL